MNAPVSEVKFLTRDVGFPQLDAIHREFDDLLARGRVARTDERLDLIRQIDAHLREHFRIEGRWMEETQFPARGCHVDEHQAVLLSSAKVLALAEQGNLQPFHSFVTALHAWIPGHVTHLDSALAAWMCKRRFGATPVVLHRASTCDGQR